MTDSEELEDASRKLAAISDWIDAHNAHRHPLVSLWSRVTKASEEAGEAQDELRLWLGENPRKPKTETDRAVVEELLDTAVAALGAVEHLRGNNGVALSMLFYKIDQVHERAMQT